MAVKLSIGRLIESPEILKDIYSARVKYMHGDADHYTEKTFDFLDLTSPYSEYAQGFTLEFLINVLRAYCTLDHNVRCDACSNSRAFAKALNLSEEDVANLNMVDFFEYDVTCDSRLAMIALVEFTYHDSNGSIFKTSVIDEDGKELNFYF